MEFQLQRTYFEKGTNGALFLQGKFLGFAIELPWKQNEKRVSCIPEGKYELVPRYSQKFKHHLLLKNVEKRSLILIHPANDALKELAGCIAPVSQLSGIGKGISSRAVFQKLVSLSYQAFERKEQVFITIKS